MEVRGHSDESWLETAVGLSLLRFAGDARACRLLLEILRAPEPADLTVLASRLADALEIPRHDQPAHFARARDAARRALDRARKNSVQPIPIGDPGYPELLRHVPDPPIVLWTRGDPASLSQPTVAVVGSRAASPASLSIARHLARDLASAGLVVASGLARGVDAAAHEGALDAGRTVAILGCGVDRIYPPEHGSLTARVIERGAVASELPPGTQPLGHHFPLRNRIISGISLGVLVVEAPLKSGSLITARMGLEQGRAVMAVPGSIASDRHQGCHALIKDGARLVESATDVLEELGWSHPVATDGDARDKSLEISRLEARMAIGETYSVDDLTARTGRSAPDLLAELGALEINGRVTKTPGGGYVRLD